MYDIYIDRLQDARDLVSDLVQKVFDNLPLREQGRVDEAMLRRTTVALQGGQHCCSERSQCPRPVAKRWMERERASRELLVAGARGTKTIDMDSLILFFYCHTAAPPPPPLPRQHILVLSPIILPLLPVLIVVHA